MSDGFFLKGGGAGNEQPAHGAAGLVYHEWMFIASKLPPPASQ
jgi:hypothetical protein